MTTISYYDLFPCGLGLDLAGATLLAHGLRTSPTRFAQRMHRSRNTFARFNVRAAEDNADAVGGAILLLGFVVQGVAYVLYISGVHNHTRGLSAALGACAFLVVGLLLGLLPGLATRRRLIRSFLIELARHDATGTRHEEPWISELQLYADLLDINHSPQDYAGPELSGQARRYWKSARGRMNADCD